MRKNVLVKKVCLIWMSLILMLSAAIAANLASGTGKVNADSPPPIRVLGISAVERVATEVGSDKHPYIKLSILFDGKLSDQPNGDWGGFWSQANQPAFDGIYQGFKINGRTLKEVQANVDSWRQADCPPIKDSALVKHSDSVWGVQLLLSMANYNRLYPAGSAGAAMGNLTINDYLFKFDGTDKIDILPSFTTQNNALKISNPQRFVLDAVDGVTVENFGSEAVTDFGVISQNWKAEALPVIATIRVKTLATKLDYVSGEDFSAAGLTIEAVMNDGSIMDLDMSKATVSGYDKFAGAGIQSITVTYEGKTVSYNVNVASSGITALSITPPANTHLIVGQIINPKLMTVTATKAAASEVLQSDSYELTYSNAEGAQTVSVRANGITQTFIARFYSTPKEKISFLGVSNVARLLKGGTPYVSFSVMFDGKLANTVDGSESGLWSKVDIAEYQGVYQGVKINGRTLKEIQKINNGGYAPNGVYPVKDSAFESYGNNVWGLKIELAAMNFSKEAHANNGGYDITDHFFKFDGTDTIEIMPTFTNAFITGALQIYNPSKVTLAADPVTKVDTGTTQDEMFPNWLKEETLQLKNNWVSNQEPIIIIDDIEVTLDKTEYIKGQLFDEGSFTSIKAVMSDGSKNNIAISQVQISGFNSEAAGTCVLSVTYQGITKQINLNIIDKIITKIEITKPSTKLSYNYGEQLSFDGEVTATYNDGSRGVITNYTLTGYNKDQSGEQTVTISFGTNNVTFKVTVGDKPASGCGASVLTLVMALSALVAVAFVSKR